jgi:hypothetical protein
MVKVRRVCALKNSPGLVIASATLHSAAFEYILTQTNFKSVDKTPVAAAEFFIETR